MSIVTILAFWTQVCAGMQWWMYKETLLCAVGYGYFPKTLRSARVAVAGVDLERLMDKLLLVLPADLELDISGFTRKRKPIRILQEGRLLLEIDVLLDGEHPELDAIRRKHDRFLTWMKYMLGKGSLYRAIAKKSQLRTMKRIATAVAQTSALVESFWDGFTDEEASVLYPAAWIRDTVMISCGEEKYPAPTGCHSYLREVYADYETGLFDDLGCGLTETDKISLKEHQQRCKEVLSFVQQLSQEFGLKYYLLAGSVLGSVRHGGFIPWDDDIDIGIRLEELDRFEALVEEYLPQRLPEGYVLTKPGVNSTYPRMFSKICYDGRCCMDLWPLVPTYLEGHRAKLLWEFAKFITKVHYKKIGYQIIRFATLLKLVNPFLSDALIMKLARKNERQFLGKTTDAYINLYSIYTRRKETILRQWLDTETIMSFEGLEVPVVGCTETYLTHLYGDYMTMPVPWKRVARHIERF